MIDQALLKDTLLKINTSLNKRFEKEADLYISKQDEYELKKHICSNAYRAVTDMIKGKNISPEIVMKVFVRNAGIISIKNIFMFEREMKPILENIQYKSVEYLMEEVLNQTVFMEKNLKHLLFQYYANGITSVKRLQYWKSTEFDLDSTERKTLFYTILRKVKHADEKKTLQYKLDFIDDALKQYPVILQDRDVFLVLKDTSSDADKDKLFQYLCREMETPSIEDELYDHILLDAYASYGSQAFEDAVSKIKEDSPKNFKQYIKAIATMLVKEKDTAISVKMFETMVKVFDSPYIKRHVKNRINNKVWKAAKNNGALYEVKKGQIDLLLANTEETDYNKYASYQDVSEAIQNGELERSIAYFWINMKGKAFEQSLVDSFQNTSREYILKLCDIYEWLFRHSKNKNGSDTLSKTCDAMASAILSYGKLTEGIISGAAGAADSLLLYNVLEYSVKGRSIREYLATYHFNEYHQYKA